MPQTPEPQTPDPQTPEPADPHIGTRPVPPSRYGNAVSPTRRRRARIAVGLLVVVACLALAVWGYQRFERLDVQGETAAFEVLDDQTVSITLSVTRKDPAKPAVCIVRVRSKDGAETGRREILVPPSQSETVQVTATVKSKGTPFVGDVYGCGLDVPGYLIAPPA